MKLSWEEKYLQCKVQECITRCSLKLSGQNGLYFSTQCSVQSQAVPALSMFILGLDWNLSRNLPNKPGSSNRAATGQVWIGPVRAWGGHRERALALGCPGSLCSFQVREEQPSWAQHPEGIATHWPKVFHYGITSSNKPKGTSFSCSHR